MTWTSEKPAEPGWYWVRCTKYIPRRGQVTILFFDTCSMPGEGSPIQPTAGGLSTEGWDEFAGPIPSPIEPEPAQEAPKTQP